jgi:hypothetical protein
MAWGWISGLFASHPDGVGLFGYLTNRDRNRTRIKLEDVRRQATNDLIDHLPCGAVYRETTTDCMREIWMPPQPQPPALLSRVMHHEPANDPFNSAELPTELRTLSQDWRGQRSRIIPS